MKRSTTSASPSTAPTVLRQFRIVFNAVKSHFQQMEKRAGIGGAQIWALSLVAEQPGLGMAALALAMDIHQSTSSNLVKTLVQRGLVKVEKDGRDRRAVCLTITAEGEAVPKSAPGPWSGVLPDALSKMDPATLARLETDLGTLIHLLDADEKAGKTPLASL